jgi:hypothetical protein
VKTGSQPTSVKRRGVASGFSPRAASTSSALAAAAPSPGTCKITAERTTLVNQCDFDFLSPTSTSLYVTLTPDDPSAVLTLQIVSATPDTADKGFVSELPLSYNAAQHRFEGGYLSKHESETNRYATDPYLQDQTVTVGVKRDGTILATINLKVLSGFKYLISQGLYDRAIMFVRIKYGVGGDVSMVYDPNLADEGQTSVAGNVTIGPSAFTSENELASTIIHEKTHVDQGYLARLAASIGAAQYALGLRNSTVCPWPNLELEACAAEVDNFSVTCLSPAEQADVFLYIQYFIDIKNECGCE